MRKLVTGVLFFVAGIVNLHAQTDLVGSWELCKVVKLPSDTQVVKSDDPRYLKYNFSYNNTFSCYHKKENEEATGRWGYDNKENALKMRKQAYIKSKTEIADFDLKLLNPINKVYFVQVIYDAKKKPVEYYIFRKM